MSSRSPFHHRPSTIVRAIALFALLLIIALAIFKARTPRSQASSQRHSLSFEERVAT